MSAAIALEDNAMKKAFVERQAKLQALHKQLQSCKQQIFKKDRDARVADLVLSELHKVGPEAVTYRQVGKCFVLTEQSVLKDSIKDKSEHDRRDVNVLESTKKYIESNMSDIQSGLQDLVKRRQELHSLSAQ